MKIAALACLSILMSVTLMVEARAPGNATWNDHGKKDTIGFWLYEKEGECAELRGKERPLVFSVKTANLAQGVHEVSSLSYCYLLPLSTEVDKDSNVKLNRCKSGQITMALDTTTRTYTGTYSLVLNDGSKREGKLTAQFCAPAPPKR